jgi:hypothetical protein
VLDPEYRRANARACEERANETSDFIMKEFWLWLAREWHELAKASISTAAVAAAFASFSRLYESIKDLPPKEQESRLRSSDDSEIFTAARGGPRSKGQEASKRARGHEGEN